MPTDPKPLTEGYVMHLRVHSLPVVFATWLAIACVTRGYSAEIPPNAVVGNYQDVQSGIITKPQDWDDIWGDCVWRSAWVYSSLLVIESRDPELLKSIRAREQLEVTQLGAFLKTFREHGAKGDGWHVPKSDQKFSTDQLAPLLYLFSCIATLENGGKYRPLVKDILLQLNDLVDKDIALSASPSGAIRPNLHYVIAQLAEKFDFEYLTHELKVASQLPKPIRAAAKDKVVGLYRTAFGVALDLQQKASLNYPHQPDVVFDETAFYNAIALVTAERFLDGADNAHVKEWRDSFTHAGKDGWGPAFRIASGLDVPVEEIAVYRNAYVCRQCDNDVILGQRAKKFITKVFPECKDCSAVDRRPVLDFVILNGIRMAWKQ